MFPKHRWLLICLLVSVCILFNEQFVVPLSASAKQMNATAEKANGATEETVQSILDRVSFASRTRVMSLDYYNEARDELIKLGPASAADLIVILENAPLRSTGLSLAVEAVCKIGDPSTIPALMEVSSSQNFSYYYGHIEFINLVAKFGDKIVPSLVDLAEHGSKSGRSVAVLTLIKLDRPEVKPYCLTAIKQQDIRLFRSAIDYFVEKNDPSIENVLIELFKESVGAAADEYQKQAHASQAIRALGTIGSEVSAGLLLGLLNDDDSPYQHEAIVALGKLKNLRATGQLIKILGDPPAARHSQPSGPNVCSSGPPAATRRQLAIDALAEIGGRKVADELLEIADPKSRAGQAAIAVLSRLGTPEARRLFESVLIDRGINKAIRTDAAVGLGKIKDPRSVPALIDAMDESPPLRVRSELIDALAAIGQPARQPLLELVTDDNYILRGGAIEVLCKINDPRDYSAIATEAGRPRNNSIAFVKEFLQFASENHSEVVVDAIWKIASTEGYVCEALKILAQQEQTDPIRFEETIVEAFKNAKYKWQLWRLLELSKNVESSDIEAVLVPLCHHESAELAGFACDCLARRNMSLLLPQIDESPEQAATVFGCLKNHPENKLAQAAVLSALNNPELASLAIDVVFKWKWKTAADQIVKISGDPKQMQLRGPARNALRVIQDVRLIEQLLKEGGYHSHTIAAFGHRSTDPMIEALKTHPALAASALCSVRDRRAVPHLKEFLKVDRYERVHFTVTTALAEMGDESGLELLTTDFMTPPGYSGHFTWEAIQRCPRTKVGPHLARLLTSKKYESQAIWTLAWFGTPSAMNRLREHYPIASQDGQKQIEKEFVRLGYLLDE